ncbi:ChbG/HpnK family deacetylase [Aequorivita antarctica]|uniref:ChbG/HpnK family deacetylase n=1 Tax=Aequorivita antarctica TaxID=153266 RepID=A0A5C6YWT4_9FLAO|nr:ChbG/HpnK family deacetylase [Aequorivita antarctica]TXD71640.1 ChbG/HpnK family deacetylase [Aequorivita antarctica]SRX75904.1 Chitooligosaccharide deacetylase ChbG [Aequorivita antarctica]
MKLIVNADDFGFSEEVNENIVKCHQKGIVTSATILSGGQKFEAAIQLAKENPKLGIGVHLAIDGPNNIGKKYATLLDPQTGEFYEDVVAVKKIRNGDFNFEELVSEYSLQIEKVKNEGITITHLDHHHHLHLYFPILKAVIEVGKKYKIPYIRPQKILYAANNPFPKNIYRLYHQFYLLNKYDTVDGYSSLIGCDENEMQTKFQSILNSNKKTIELVVHPLKENGEIDFLTSPEIVEKAQNHLINYADLI